MDDTKKYILVNPDATAGEADTARLYPVSTFRGLESTSATAVTAYFADAGQAGETTVAFVIASGKIKELCQELAEEINFGKDAVIKLVDRASSETFSEHIDTGSTVTITEGS